MIGPFIYQFTKILNITFAEMCAKNWLFKRNMSQLFTKCPNVGLKRCHSFSTENGILFRGGVEKYLISTEYTPTPSPILATFVYKHILHYGIIHFRASSGVHVTKFRVQDVYINLCNSYSHIVI